jgi:hypothetical protein
VVTNENAARCAEADVHSEWRFASDELLLWVWRGRVDEQLVAILEVAEPLIEAAENYRPRNWGSTTSIGINAEAAAGGGNPAARTSPRGDIRKTELNGGPDAWRRPLMSDPCITTKEVSMSPSATPVNGELVAVADMPAALTAATLVFGDGATQVFTADGNTTYVEQGRTTIGKWLVVSDGKFSSFWPPDYRATYTLQWIVEGSSPTGLSFTDGRGQRFDGRYRPECDGEDWIQGGAG